MGTGIVPADDALEVELAALRARAYAADADIDDDPEALGRLAELEAWHAAGLSAPAADVRLESDDSSVIGQGAGDSAAGKSAAGDPAAPAQPPASRPRVQALLRRAARSGAVLFALGAAATACVVLAGAALWGWGGPRADVTLAPTSAQPQPYVLRLTDSARQLLIDKSTLRTYETYRGVELWSAASVLGNSCLLALEPTSDRLLAAGCVPPGADPIIEIYDVPVYSRDRWHDGLPTGTVVRFIQNDHTVSVWLYPGAPPS